MPVVLTNLQLEDNMSIDFPQERPTIESLMLANHAEAVNGLLYVSGGGWTDHTRVIQGNNMPLTHLGLAVSIRVPWNQTNRIHQLAIDIENEDATEHVSHVEATMSVGRPPMLPPGSDQHAALALNADIMFPGPGSYRLIASLDGETDVRHWTFRIHDTHVGVAAAG
jgi:hypothetical protein